MSPKVLIVADAPRRATLKSRVAVLGYDVSDCDPAVVGPHLEEHPAPAAIVVCVPDVETATFMARLRRARGGAAVPVILCGRLGGIIGELADVLDLGADHFLDEPIRDEPLRAALDALAGPASPVGDPHVRPLVFASVGARGGPGETASESGAPFEPFVLDEPRQHVPPAMRMAGSLRAVEVPRLVWSLQARRFHGRLQLARGHVSHALWWSHGGLVYAHGDPQRTPVRDVLSRSGWLTAEQAERVGHWPQMNATEEFHRCGQEGLLGPRETQRAMDHYAQAVLHSTFAWTLGEWRLFPNEEPPQSIDPSQAPSREAVIVTGVAQHVEVPQLWSWLGGPAWTPSWSSQVRPQTLGEHAPQWSIPERARAWFDQWGGDASLGDLVERLPASEQQSYLALVYALWVIGALELQRVPQPAEDAEVSGRRIASRIQERLRLARGADYFRLLGVAPTATRLEIRRAHRALRDTFSDEALDPTLVSAWAHELEELRAALDQAYELLDDDAIRSAYLAHLARA